MKTSAQKISRYLSRMLEIRGLATPETSYYAPLGELLNAIGDTLNPKVKTVEQLRNIGSGIPDFGLCTAEQLKRVKGDTARVEKPERGVVEAKKTADEIDKLLHSEQTAKYAKGYGLVLTTNYREFALVEQGEKGAIEMARYSLAVGEEEFWEMAKHPQKTAAVHADSLCEFLRRALIHKAPITSAEDVAVILASYAREALNLLEQGNESALNPLRTALEKALSMKFKENDGTHFFCSTLAQTIFYGLFSAWMETPARFDWRSAAFSVKTPVMSALFGEIVNPDRLGRLGLEKLLDGATAALNRVEDKESLFGGMGAGKAIQHFYEPFLADFDPDLRKKLGVWYTPPEIVRYMVERTDRVLREELNITDGLANDRVHVLDPCGGTGAYVAETLRRIYRTCQERGDGELAAQTVKDAASKRIFGFEILSASYVVAHWQIGALLAEIGAPLKKNERAAVYLTNSLTDWNEDKQIKLSIKGLEEEYQAANEIKREKPILVILGNPPYNAFAGLSPEEEEGLVAPYKEGLIKKWNIKKFNLDDLYVRFFRMAENRITKTGKGIVSFISNYSYTSEPSFVVMRQSLLKNFDKLWIENMHGDRNKTEYAPDGRSSDTIFAMRGVSPGIRQGIVIALAVKTGDSEKPATVHYRDDLHEAKADERRAQLLASLDDKNFEQQYQKAVPQEWNKFSFRPMSVSADFLRWPSLVSIAVNVYNGPIERRSMSLIRFPNESQDIINAIQSYLRKV